MKKGDIIEIEYTGYADEKVFDTTNPEVAKENSLPNPESIKPLTVVIGESFLIKGFEEDILKAERDEERKVTIPPEDAYGVRNSKLVELFSTNEILRQPQFRKKDAVPPYVGMDVEVNGRNGTITHLTPGRIRVDFNHFLAGKELTFVYKVTKIPETPEEILSMLIRAHYGTSEGFEYEFSEDVVKISLTPYCKFDERWKMVKHTIAMEVAKRLDLEKVVFMEAYTNPEKLKKSQEENNEEGAKEENSEESQENSESADSSEEVKESSENPDE